MLFTILLSKKIDLHLDRSQNAQDVNKPLAVQLLIWSLLQSSEDLPFQTELR